MLVFLILGVIISVAYVMFFGKNCFADQFKAKYGTSVFMPLYSVVLLFSLLCLLSLDRMSFDVTEIDATGIIMYAIICIYTIYKFFKLKKLYGLKNAILVTVANLAAIISIFIIMMIISKAFDSKNDKRK